MARKQWAGAGRVYLDGQLLADVESAKQAGTGQTQRIVTLAGATGEVSSDPTGVKIDVKNAIARTAAELKRIYRAKQQQREVTLKLVCADFALVATGKIIATDVDLNSPKSEFSFSFEGDEQPLQDA